LTGNDDKERSISDFTEENHPACEKKFKLILSILTDFNQFSFNFEFQF